jgi:hypothetical protein
MFYCIFCHYSSQLKSNFIRHLKSEKHMDVVNNQLMNKDNTFSCIFCKFRIKSKEKYNKHIDICMVKNVNKYFFGEPEFGNTIKKKHVNDIKTIKKSVQSMKRKLELERTKNFFLIKILNKLIIYNYINISVFRNKVICSNNSETTKILKWLNNIKKENTKVNNSNVIIFLNKKVDQANFLEKIISNEKNINKEYQSNIKDKVIYNNENILNNKSKQTNYDVITDCGIKYFYDNKTNIVYNEELEIIGKRIHDKECPFCKTEKKCWFYVKYSIIGI